MSTTIKQLCISTALVFMMPLLCYGDVLTVKSINGSVGYRYTEQETEAATSLNHQLNAGIGMSGYFWQPWFITSRLNINMSTNESESQQQTNNHNVTTGSLGLNFLPLSIYPLTINYTTRDRLTDTENFISSAQSEETTSSESLNIKQEYLGNTFNIQGIYTRFDAKRNDNLSSNQETMALNFNAYGLNNNVAGTISQSESGTAAGDKYNGFNAVINHNYHPVKSIRMENMVSQVNNESSSPLGAGGGTESIATINQASSHLQYISEDKKIIISGDVRGATVDTETDSIASATSVSSLRSDLRYTISDRLHASANISQTSSETPTTSNTTTTKGANISYNLNPRKMDAYTYTMSTSAGYSQQTSGESDVGSTSLSFGHGLSHQMTLGNRRTLRSRIYQSLSYGDNSTQKETKIKHNISLAYSNNSTDSNSLISLRADDHRPLLSDSEYNQTLNIQASRKQRLSRRTNINGNITYNASSQRLKTSANEYNYSGLSGSASYSFSRPFGLQRFSFSSSFSINTSLSSEVDSSVNSIWNNKLNYVLGKLTSSTSIRFTEREGIRSKVFLFDINRRF